MRKVYVIAPFVCALAAIALAQNEPVFRTTSEVVLVPASVLDKHGQPVAGLKIEDFELRVDGKPVRITGLNEISGSAPSVATARPLPSNAVTNVPAVNPSQPSLVILLVDFINTSLPARVELRNQLVKFLAKDLRPGHQVALYALSSSLAMLHPFTSDTQTLIAAASRLMREHGTPGPSGDAGSLGPVPTAGATGTDVESFLLWGQWRQEVFTSHARAANTLAQFRQLANSFAGVPGKKTVLWLTGDASPLNPTLMNPVSLGDPSAEPLRVQWQDVAATYEALNVAGISLFPVDIRGVINPGLASAGETPSHADFMQNLAQSQQGDNSPYSGATSRRQGESANAVMAMETAAVETGGEVLKGSNELGELLARAQGLWSSYYVLAFTPERASRGKTAIYHRIEVKVPGRAAEVLSRRGYMARPESLIASEGELKRDVADASTSPVDLTAIPLTLRWAPDGGPHFTLAIPAAMLQRSDTPKGARYDFSIFILVKNSKGKVLSNLGDKIDRVFSPAEAAGIAKHGFLYPGQFDATGKEKLFGRIIVRDNLGGHVGSLTVPLGRD